MGFWWLGQWAFGALPLLHFYYFPHSTREEFLLLFSMAHILYLIVGHPAVPQEELLLIPLSIPPEATVEPAHPKLFQLSTHPLDFLPLYDQAIEQALKLNIVGCQLAVPLHFETHLIFVPRGSPQYGFF